MAKSLMDLYNDVFDEDGNMKDCDVKTRKLLVGSIFDFTNGEKVGDIYTGFIDVEKCKKVYEDILNL